MSSPTPETDAEWGRLQRLPGGGYSSQVSGFKLALGMSRWASEIELQRDEARNELEKSRFALRGAQQGSEEARKAIQRINRELDEAHELARELRDKLLAVYDLPDDCPCAISNDALAAWHDVGIVLAKAKEVLGEA